MNDDNAQDVLGGCYCGGVRFSIPGGTRPALAGYCHCSDCRQAHAATLYQAAYVDEGAFHVTSGSELLNWYTRTESARDRFQRHFCVRCGTKVFNKLQNVVGEEEVKWIGTFPSLFDDRDVAASDTWGAQLHLFCDQSILDLSQLHDDLPKHPGDPIYEVNA